MVAGVMVAVSPALAGYAATTPTRLPDNPLANKTQTCADLIAQEYAALPNTKNYPDAEVEPWIAASGGGTFIGAFQQDRWNDGGANGLTIATLRNNRWQLASAQPKFSICAGAAPGTAAYRQRATDPWVSVSPNGVAYAISDSFDATGPGFGGPSTILISQSTDGGNKWGDPVSVEFDSGAGVLNDKESITADPTDSNRAYATWDRLQNPSLHAKFDAFNHTFSYRGPTMFSSTSDGGKTWSAGHVIYDPGQWNQTIGNQIVVQPDGTLVDLFDLINNEHGPFGAKASTTFQVAIIRSSDHGATWSRPTVVADIVDTQVKTLDGHDVRTGDILPVIAVNSSNGNLYTVYQTNASIAFSQSTDGGSTWSTPVSIGRSGSAQAFTPSIGVAANGTLGVSYYDFRNATTARPSYTRTWFDTCSSGCASPTSWSEIQLDTAGGFDMNTAPDAGGYFVGDYASVAPNGTSGFRPLWVMAQPQATTGPTDAFSSTVSSS
jgi:hypothetical protein